MFDKVLLSVLQVQSHRLGPDLQQYTVGMELAAISCTRHDPLHKRIGHDLGLERYKYKREYETARHLIITGIGPKP